MSVVGTETGERETVARAADRARGRRRIGTRMKSVRPATVEVRPSSKPAGAASQTEARGLIQAPDVLVPDAEAVTPFPMDALPQIMREAALGITDMTQCPQGLAGTVVLAAATAVAQAHVDAPLRESHVPTSLFIVTIGVSGEGKSRAEHLAMREIAAWADAKQARYQQQRADYEVEYDEWEKRRRNALRAAVINGEHAGHENPLAILGDAPVAPISGHVLFNDFTGEGLFRECGDGPGWAMLSSDEAGTFIQGHALEKDRQAKTGGELSRLWSGGEWLRLRAKETTALKHKRVSLHLLGQPNIMAQLLNNRMLLDQGLLARTLMCHPPSTIGHRDPFHKADPKSAAAVEAFNRRLGDSLARKLATHDGRNELAPKPLFFDESDDGKDHNGNNADDLLRAFGGECEKLAMKGGQLEHICAICMRAEENAARMAAIFAFTRAPDTAVVTADDAARAIAVARWYLWEAARLIGAAPVDEKARDAMALFDWIKTKFAAGSTFTASDVQREGPARLRAKRVNDPLLTELVASRYLEDITPEQRGRVARTFRVCA